MCDIHFCPNLAESTVLPTFAEIFKTAADGN